VELWLSAKPSVRHRRPDLSLSGFFAYTLCQGPILAHERHGHACQPAKQPNVRPPVSAANVVGARDVVYHSSSMPTEIWHIIQYSCTLYHAICAASIRRWFGFVYVWRCTNALRWRANALSSILTRRRFVHAELHLLHRPDSLMFMACWCTLASCTKFLLTHARHESSTRLESGPTRRAAHGCASGSGCFLCQVTYGRPLVQVTAPSSGDCAFEHAHAILGPCSACVLVLNPGYE
jgi:hypothetical protein